MALYKSSKINHIYHDIYPYKLNLFDTFKSHENITFLPYSIIYGLNTEIQQPKEISIINNIKDAHNFLVIGDYGITYLLPVYLFINNSEKRYWNNKSNQCSTVYVICSRNSKVRFYIVNRRMNIQQS